MKLEFIICTMTLLACINGYTQTNPRMTNENYMYTLLYDGFDGPTLNEDIWNVEAGWKRKNAMNIWVNSSNTVSQSNGKLNLTMLASPGYTIIMWDGDTITADYISGEVTSDSTFLYGSYECSVKYANDLGSWPAFWAIGGDGIPCEQGGGAGDEIDISEFWNVSGLNLIGQCYSVIKLENNCHRYYPPDDCENSKFTHYYNNLMSSSMDNNFHVYKCIWTPDKIDFYMDNQLKSTLQESAYQQFFPFHRLNVKLSQQVADLPCRYIQCPQTSYFDYVKIKQFFLAPQISRPSVICSSGTISLDVDPLATNISWVLSPSSLFTTTSGTGKDANVTKAAGESGQGTITYTFQMPSGESFTKDATFWVGSPEYSFQVTRPDGYPVTNDEYGNLSFCENTDYVIHILANDLLHCYSYDQVWDVPSSWTINYNNGSTISINTNNDPYNTLTVDAVGDCCAEEFTISQLFEYSTSCAQYSLVLTPNPTSGETTITLVSSTNKKSELVEEWDFDVYDSSQGLKIKQQKIKTSSQTINTSSWREGVYFIKARIGKNLISDKLIVKH